MSLFYVNTEGLILRSQPVVIPSTKITVLHYGQIVEKEFETSDPNWWKVIVIIGSISVAGFVNKNFLSPKIQQPVPQHPIAPPNPTYFKNKIPEAHLNRNSLVTRKSTAGRAFALNEPAQPYRTAATSNDKAAQIATIINWLEVEQSIRYKRTTVNTYCNIYAYDFCFLGKAYLPRVWWTNKSIEKIKSGGSIDPIYDSTVTELNANSLYNWFKEFGDDFGWRREFDLTKLQEEANNGKICIMSARRKETNLPGHICAVVPETSLHKAVRKNGVVTTPLQSNAGATNFRYGGSIWWTSSKFFDCAFWVHD